MKNLKSKGVLLVLTGLILMFSFLSLSGCKTLSPKKESTPTVGEYLAEEKPSW